MTGQRGLRGRPRRLEIPNLTDHHHVRVVTQDGTQPHGERHADFVVDRDLVHALEVVLHRILGSDHLFLWADDGIERGIKRGRFTAAGRAGDEENAVRLVDQPLKLSERFLVQPQLREAVKNGRLVKDAHHDALAKNHRDHAHTNIHLPAADRELDAAVLWQSPLGDVHVREYLNTADDRRLEPIDLRRHGGLLQHAVDTVSNRERPLVRLNMNVASALVNRLKDNLVDQLDDAGLLRHLQQVLAVILRAGEGEILTAGHFLNRVATDAVVLLDDLINLVEGSQHRPHLQPGQQLDLVEHI